ncbi:MAG: hypothetical protein ACI82F_002677 [Planctomycetota bacterium]|jgi:hypothetical protein
MIKFRHNSTYKRKIITLPTGFKNLHLDHKDRCILEAVDTFTPESELFMRVINIAARIHGYQSREEREELKRELISKTCRLVRMGRLIRQYRKYLRTSDEGEVVYIDPTPLDLPMPNI